MSSFLKRLFLPYATATAKTHHAAVAQQALHDSHNGATQTSSNGNTKPGRMASSKQDDISFLPLGAIIHNFTVAGLPLVLSLPDQQAYISTTNPAYFGETIGRVANRIPDGQIRLNDKTYKLNQNNGTNTLHGGPKGWGKQIWSGPHAENRNGKESVRFELLSKDGDEGFPGTVLAKVWYTAYTAGNKTSLEVEYEVVFASADSDESGSAHGERVLQTAINLTNHTAFTVAPLGHNGASRSLEGTKVTLYTDLRQEVDAKTLIPTGRITKHEGIPAAGQAVELGKSKPVFDDCFVLPGDAASPSSVPLDTRTRSLQRLMGARHDATGMNFEAWSTEPAFQFYTGEYIDLKHKGQTYGKRAGFCCEASRFVDAASREEWRAQVLLKRGGVWGSKTVYTAWKD